MPYDRVGFENRDYISQVNWPVNYDELISYCQRACCGLETTRRMLASRDHNGRALEDHSGHLRRDFASLDAFERMADAELRPLPSGHDLRS
jgi:NifB/MoaA-like Fe-S oxidoreductase